MATERQIEANRRNAQKSTGPSSVEGRAVSRCNAVKTGIYAKSTIIPGEDPAQLEALTADYHRQFQPATPLARFLVDSLVDAEWQLRRFRTIEAQLWLHESDSVRKCCNVEEDRTLGLAFIRRVDVFTRLQRRIDAAQRTYARALKQLQGLDADLDAAPAEPETCQAPLASLPAPVEIGFVPSPDPRTLPPAVSVQEPLLYQKCHVAHAVPPGIEFLLSQPRRVHDRNLAKTDARIA
jgi:hypothetical protein